MFFVLMCCLAALCQGVLGGNDLRINTASELIQFSKNVSSGTNYKGTTVFLDANIDFSDGLSEQFEPIGSDESISFQGTFDGQGHTISNLVINSSSEYAGLFGYSNGATIRNVVLDSSCSVMNSFSGSFSAFVGGINGYCEADKGFCTIENNANMASVTFTGSTVSYDLYLGGVAGWICASNKEATVKNCANYGSVTHHVKIYTTYTHIGGIVGFSQGSSPNKVFIQNCLNYGTITHNGTSANNLYIGGVLGHTEQGTSDLENCVNGGKISVAIAPGYKYIGSVVGCAITGSTKITHCYWSSDVGYNKACGSEYSIITESTSFNSVTFELSETVSVGNYTENSLFDALNAAADYYYLRDYSHWLLNKDSKNVSFTINNRAKPLTLNTQLILLPNLASEGKLWFDGWYTDNSCTQPLTDFEISSKTPLYGKWEENNNYYTITFDTRGGSPVPGPITEQFGNTVNLPSNVTKERFVLGFWETDYGDKVSFDFTVPAHNITLHAVWLCTRLNTAKELIEFSRNVNSGKSYSGITVFLDADIDFSGGLSERFEPIGAIVKYFQGVFDGQGHTIRNLVMNSSSSYVGLFGYSKDATIRNVILDSSCSVVSHSLGLVTAYVGGIVGECESGKGFCTIESTVNMASVSFTGSVTSNLYLGAIAGILITSGNEATVRNCANYGSVTLSGKTKYAELGGIVGYSEGISSSKLYIQNCLNYGKIMHSGTTSNEVNIGGVLGFSSYSIFENCVSVGKISSNKEDKCYIGSIVGEIKSGATATITHCHWTSDVGNYKASGSSPTIDTETKLVSLNETTVDSLNSYNTSWNRWLLNTNSKSVTFKVNSGKGFSISSQPILLPSLTESESHTFSGWFEDEEHTEKFTGSSVKAETVLYAGWRYVVTFDSAGGVAKTSSKSVVYGQKYGDLPSAIRTGYTFTGWFTEKEEDKGEKVTAEDTVTKGFDHTLYAQWIINKYTLTFVFGNGTTTSTVFNYNDTIVYPVNPERGGYTFGGWDKTIKRMPAENTVITALWLEKPSELVEIVLEVNNMTKEEAKTILEKYTDEEFTIEDFEIDEETGETTIVIKFVDTIKAEDFVRTVNEFVRKSSSGFIRRVNIVETGNPSFLFKVVPFFVLLFVAA